jgi:aminopeptidase N
MQATAQKAQQTGRGPFTHAPRSVRSRAYDVKHIRLEFAFDWDQRQFTGRATQTLEPFVACHRVELDAAKMQIQKVRLVTSEDPGEGTPLKFDHQGQRLAITLDRTYESGEELKLAIDYRVVRPERGVHFVVPDPREPSQPRVLWTQSEPDYARYWFPCFDSPNDRATSETLTTVPEGYFVLSNGELVDEKANEDGTVTWHWVQKQTHVAYLISVVAGRFEAFEQSWDGVPVVSYGPPEQMAQAARAFGKTAAMVQYFSDKIGYRYPWPKYTQIACDEYGGGMEHTSATTLTLSTLRDERAYLDYSPDRLVAHELAHQWWGDLLTCKDWAEIWLNESFASYFEIVWAEHDRGEDEARWELHKQSESYLNEDRSRYRRPIVSYQYNAPQYMFDRHTYPKGSRVLHMLRFVLGEEGFDRALRHYCHKHAFGVVETADLRVAIEEATGQGMNWFFDQWLYHGGHPVLDVSHTWDPQTQMLSIVVKQTQTVDELTPLFRMPVDLEMVVNGKSLLRRATISKAEETFHFHLEEEPSVVCFDPQDWLLKELTVHKSKQQWLEQLAHSHHMTCRFRAVQALKAFKPDEAVRDALAKTARCDDFWAVREEAVRVLKEFPGKGSRAVLIEVAREDEKPAVRREAVSALAEFPHDDTRSTLRGVIAEEASYPTVAAALRSLVKIDREGCSEDLLAAMQCPSDGEVILKAAAEGLVEIQATGVKQQLLDRLEAPSSYQQRTAVLQALAKVGEGDPAITKVLLEQLEDQRHTVRLAAIVALGHTGDLDAIGPLQKRRAKETRPSSIKLIDDTIAKLRNRTTVDRLRKDVESLRGENRNLRHRVEKLETIDAKSD